MQVVEGVLVKQMGLVEEKYESMESWKERGSGSRRKFKSEQCGWCFGRSKTDLLAAQKVIHPFACCPGEFPVPFKAVGRVA